jgi:hypothetical protein
MTVLIAGPSRSRPASQAGSFGLRDDERKNSLEDARPWPTENPERGLNAFLESDFFLTI